MTDRDHRQTHDKCTSHIDRRTSLGASRESRMSSHACRIMKSAGSIVLRRNICDGLHSSAAAFVARNSYQARNRTFSARTRK